MGSATIISHLGESLYSIQRAYDMTALEAELARLEQAEIDYAALILTALNTLALLEDDAAIARDSMNAILQQWIDGIIAAGAEEPEPLKPDDPNDPETGLPWVDPDRAQEAPLLALINDARTAASIGTVSRDDDLDDACLAHLRYQAGTGAIGHTGQWRSKPSDRATQQGYYRPEVIYELLAYGEDTPARVMSRWQREPTTWANLLADDVIHAGVAHVYARTHPGSYLWAVLLASAKGDPATATVEEDPADAAAEDTETALDAIKPTPDKATPEKLGEAVRLFALAQNKVVIADREVARLMAERLERLRRIDELETIQAQTILPISAWAYRWNTELEPGTTVGTAEVPGFWRPELATDRTTTFGVRNDPDSIYPDTEFTYTEYPLTIIDAAAGGPGVLRLSETLSAESVFVNAALEPGHLKWKPLWRYGVITSLAGNLCDVTMESVAARDLPGRPIEQAMPLDEVVTLSSVPISYPPCHGEAFSVGDAVLILFEGYDRNIPKVIGFRREPRPCFGGRTSWTQII